MPERETCRYCGANVFYLKDFCPKCQRSKIDGSISPAHRAIESFQNFQRYSFISRAWKGEEPLGKVFLIYNVLFIILFYVLIAIRYMISTLQSSKAFGILFFLSFAVGMLFLSAYSIWLLVSMWRCATTSHIVFKVLARIWVVTMLIITLNTIRYILLYL